MLLRRIFIPILILGFLASCGNGDPGRETQARRPPGAPEFPKDRALIDTGEESMLIDVEVAETEEQRQFGLMHRDSLPADQGMIFIFFRDTQGPFWMKNTRIPLSIAFFDLNGRIVKILDMEPCEANPCPLYDPGVTYRGALEVNRGAFDRWGVEEGDFVRLNR
jgi:uncharacterized membrane protein (UPF0127 family)